jgi:glycosyltransferase involved in cell wall biosynthesis
MTESRFSVVIPLIPQHVKFVRKLLKELSAANNEIAEIIFCASSQTESSINRLHEAIHKSNFKDKAIILTTEKDRTAGENRNLGWSLAKNEYICFLDADDSYNPYMFEVFKYCFEQIGCDLILHDYFRFFPNPFLRTRRTIHPDRFVSNSELIENTFNRKELSDYVLDQSINTNLILPPRLRNFHRIQHGHATVRREVSIRYSNRRVGEDGRFAQEILLNGYQVLYLPLRLSNYDRPTLPNLSKSLVLRIFERASKIKRFFATLINSRLQRNR